MMNKLNKKLEKLQKILKGFKNVLLAFSGGVDSAFLLKIAKDVLANNVLAVTARSETYSREECGFAKKIAGKLKAKHMIITTCEMRNKNFRDNPPNRCYFCKSELFTRLKQIAMSKRISYVIDASHYDDTFDFRPGMKAIKELKIRSPLKEAGLTKQEIRIMSRKMKLPTWNKPASPCLASRIPYGEKIEATKLSKILAAENYLKKSGFGELRVRLHHNLARIELPIRYFDKIMKKRVREQVIRNFKSIGFIYIALDLQGFRSGSLNEVLRLNF